MDSFPDILLAGTRQPKLQDIFSMTSLRRTVSAFILVCYVAAGCKQPQPPQYLGIVNIRLARIDAVQTNVSGDVKFFNPNPYQLELKKAEMDIYLNDKLANHYLLDSTINIPANDSFWVPVLLRINPQAIFSNALQAVINDQVNIRLDGHARVKKGGLGFRVPIQYTETERLSHLLQGQ